MSTGPLTSLIEQRLATLSPTQARVGRAVLADPRAIAHLSADELARLAEVSQASVTRFCQALGLDSYQALRLRIAEEAGHSDRSLAPEWDTTQIEVDLPVDAEAGRVLRVLVDRNVRAMQLAAGTMDLASVDRAVALLAGARRIDIYGVDGSGILAQELEMLLFRIGLPARAWVTGHLAHTSAALLDARDVAVAISDSGNTREVHEAVVQAGERGAATIAITRNRRSPVARAADVTLAAFGGDPGVRIRSFASRHAQLLLVDLLYVRLVQRDYDRATEAIGLTAHIQEAHGVKRPRAGTR